MTELKLILAFVLQGLIHSLKFRRTAGINLLLVACLGITITIMCIPDRSLAFVLLLQGP